MKRTAFSLTMFSSIFSIGVARADQEANMTMENVIAVSSVAANRYHEVHDLEPFTHVARIPADSDRNTIRFEGVKLVQAPTRIMVAMNPESCEELAFRDPGGSALCPYSRMETPIAAYRVTYSYVAPPLASDESAGRKFTFDVYFRVDELPAAMKTALTRRAQNRADLAGISRCTQTRNRCSESWLTKHNRNSASATMWTGCGLTATPTAKTRSSRKLSPVWMITSP